MDSDGTALEHLSRGECMRLIASVPVGRIVYTRQALPAVEVVNFTVDRGDIVFRTSAGGKLTAAISDAVVAFEADIMDFTRHAGWSVTVVGQCRTVTDSDEIRRLERSGLRPWAPGERKHFIKITPVIVNGRRLVTGQQEATGDAHRL
jgi:nitroimidazol reductase NimA-like FMN-containing flavoprotein (pyridoxamine 5'-phosphate oxidase superfamily)